MSTGIVGWLGITPNVVADENYVMNSILAREFGYGHAGHRYPLTGGPVAQSGAYNTYRIDPFLPMGAPGVPRR